MRPEFEYPPARQVEEGAHLRIVAPAGPFDRSLFEDGVSWLRTRYEVSYSEEIFSQSGYLAGSDERRLRELNDAIRDDQVDAIVCARGGFGCTRILPGLSLEEIGEANKLLIGFSDVTALHSLWSQAGVRSIHAPMVAALGRASEEIRNSWVAAVENKSGVKTWDLNRLDLELLEGVTAGRLIGGNLAVLGSLLGTPYQPTLAGAILFIEDVGERPYRVDRILTTLRQAGWFDQISALIIGSFTEGAPGPDGVSIDSVFESYFSKAGFPVLADFPAGHIEDNEPIEFGRYARIEASRLVVG